MKTAVSLPDEVFTRAEKLAKRLKISRSELYGRALGEYVARHAPDAVTEALDRICSDPAVHADAEKFATSVSRRTLGRSEW